MTDTEMVVLLADDGTPVGEARKDAIHDADTRLHLAFSCHLLHLDGRLVVTRRALTKRTWPGVWTNAVCGHPAPGEDLVHAVHRRVQQELGVAARDVRVLLPDFRYRAVDASGIVEHEICPVFVATIDAEPEPDATEVAEWAWTTAARLGRAVEATPFAFSPWLVAHLPDALPLLVPGGRP